MFTPEKRKRRLTVLLLVSAFYFIPLVSAFAQILHFTYDAAGNRIERKPYTGSSRTTADSPGAPGDDLAGPEVSIYPNATQDLLYVSLQGPAAAVPADIRIFDLQGRLVARKRIETGGIITFDLTACASGVYLLKFMSKNKHFSSKILKH